jgi:hypothetical protein
MAPPPTLRSRVWWKDHEDQFIKALAGRVLAIKAGLEPGPVEELLDIFYHGQHTPWRKKGAPKTADAVVLKLISDADKLAREAQNGNSVSDVRSEEDRGDVGSGPDQGR